VNDPVLSPSGDTPANPAGRAGFTLVELLVVIGIIAILMSILLPTLGRVREQANATMCASNLRQFGTVLNLYATENKGRAPIGYAGQKHAGYMVWQNGWAVMGTLAEGRYLDAGIKAFYCPSKLDPRWQFNTGENPWPPPAPGNVLTRLGNSRACVRPRRPMTRRSIADSSPFWRRSRARRLPPRCSASRSMRPSPSTPRF
jgi:prepilin-type N-terminal cleavage/methylation domain-containing protein